MSEKLRLLRSFFPEKEKKLSRTGLWRGIAGGLLLFLVIEVLWLLGQPDPRSAWSWITPPLFFAGSLLLAIFLRPEALSVFHWKASWLSVVLFLAGIGAGLVHAFTESTAAAWGFALFLFALFLSLDEFFSIFLQKKSFFFRSGVHLLLALACGGTLALVGQLESHFADEEFFIALQALALAVFWLALRLAWSFLSQYFPRSMISGKLVLKLKPSVMVAVFLVFFLVFGFWSVRRYQADFFPAEAPAFPGISANSPFLCGQVAADPSTYAGKETFQRLMNNIAVNPAKGVPEFGMLALGSSDDTRLAWEKQFHDSLLAEARAGLYTGPAGSMKSAQYEAALRVYYYARVLEAFPSLFTPTETSKLHAWFAAINWRAWTLEPVDLLYALAFSKLPQAPYENQEIGAGLLSLLQSNNLAAPELSVRNSVYLDANPRGWQARFRVTDDAAVYQPELINNALFQSLYTGHTEAQNMRLSFEWLALQSLPDGSPLQYNHVYGVTDAGIGLLAAQLTGDPSYVWLAGRALDYLAAHGGSAVAQPGIVSIPSLTGLSPTQGSCLLYGGSGLPNQIGPLAPDKIVLRDGWMLDSTYLLYNLRFTGWHRYKATNTVTSVYKGEHLLVENTSAPAFSWLPVGRSLFRDKRIPRENLNGLVVPRTGMSEVLYRLTWFDGPWAQDPPYYATVVSFDPQTSTAVTEISNWRGWDQTRTLSLGTHTVTITDDAHGPAGSSAAIMWHFAPGAVLKGNRVILPGGEVLITISMGESLSAVPEASGLRVEIHGKGSIQATLELHFEGEVP